MNVKIRIILLSFILASVLPAGEIPKPAYYLPFDGNLEPAAGKELGTPESKGSLEYVKGRHGQALMLKDTSHLITKLPTGVSKGQFTIAFWIKPLWRPDDNLVHPILCIPGELKKIDGAGWAPRMYILQKGATDTIAPNHFYGVSDTDLIRRNMSPDKWTHIAIVYDVEKGEKATYINGIGIIKKNKNLKAPYTERNRMWIGGRPNIPWQGNIIIDELKIFNQPLAKADLSLVAGEKFPEEIAADLLLGSHCDISKAIETPHTKWGKPLAGGKIKTLFITEAKRAREIIELCQRLDIDPDLIISPNLSKGEPPTLDNPELFIKMGGEIDATLKEFKPECVVIAAFGWNLIPETTRRNLLKYVEDGGGLLMIAPRCLGTKIGNGLLHAIGGGVWMGWEHVKEVKDIKQYSKPLALKDIEFLTANVPFDDIRNFKTQLSGRKPSTLFTGTDLGKGRILFYDIYPECYASKICMTPGFGGTERFSQFDYDYALSPPARAVLWTAKRNRDIRIKSISMKNQRNMSNSFYIGSTCDWIVEIENKSNKPQYIELNLEARVQGPEKAFCAKRNVTIKPGISKIKISQKLSQIGTLFGDFRILQKGKTVDWGTGTVEVESSGLKITELSSDKQWYSVGDKPTITVKFSTISWGREKRVTPSELKWRLYDTFGRMIAKGKKDFTICREIDPLPQQQLTVSELPANSLCYTLYIDVIIRKRLNDQKTLLLKIPVTSIDDFSFVSWAGLQNGADSPTALALNILRRDYGLTAVSQGSWYSTDKLLKAGLEYLALQNLRGWIYCTHLGTYTKGGKERVPDLADPAYLKSLEKLMTRITQTAAPYNPIFYSMGDETKLGAPNLKASDYEQHAFRNYLKNKYLKLATFNETHGTDFKQWSDISIPEPDKLKNEAGEPDVRSFRETLYANAINAGTNAALKIDSHAKVGVEGLFGLSQAYTGQDYSKLAPAATFLGMYDFWLNTFSGMQNNMVRSFLRKGGVMSSWWNYMKLDKYYSLYGPWHVMLTGGRIFAWFTTFSANQYTMLNPDFTPFTQFKWTIEELKPLLDGIGKLFLAFERDNLGIAVLYNQRNLVRYSRDFHSVAMLCQMLDDLQLQHDFVDSKMIQNGEMSRRGMKVLVLGGQRIMDINTANAIKKFVKNGGYVISNDIPAQTNGFKKFSPSPLKEIFTTSPDKSPKNWYKYGKGMTYIVGGTRTYGYKRMNEKGEKIRKDLMAFLFSTGFKKQAVISATDGSFQPLYVVTSHDKSNLYISFQREYTATDLKPRDFKITIPQKAHFYHTNTGQYLGYGNSAILKNLEPARGLMVACLSYKAESIKFSGLKNSYKKGSWIKGEVILDATEGTPGKNVFRIETYDPKGNKVEPLSFKSLAEFGHTSLTLPMAFNDPSGKWTIKATDIATETTATFPFELVD